MTDSTCFVPGCNEESTADLSINKGPDKPICDEHTGNLLEGVKGEDILGMRLEGQTAEGHTMVVDFGDI